jgi:hypothetical protein
MFCELRSFATILLVEIVSAASPAEVTPLYMQNSPERHGQ